MASKHKTDHKYSDDEIEFLKINVNRLSYPDLTYAFNEKYGTSIGKSSIISLLRRRGIHKEVRMKAKYIYREGAHVYTDEEREWIRDAVYIYDSYREITDSFNEQFNTSVKPQSIIDQVRKVLGLRLNKNVGCFKTGRDIPGTKPIGSEAVYNGYIFIKVNDVYHKGKTTSKQFRENWKPKHVYIYEQAYGPLDSDKIVIFLDSNKRNFDLNNLYAIDRKISVIMAKNRWFTTSRERTLTAIKWCELYYTTHKKGEIKNDNI